MAPSSPAGKRTRGSRSLSKASATDQSDVERLARATHLVVMQHGLLGSEKDLEHFERLFAEQFGDDGVFVYCGQRNAESLFQTWDGVDQGGERLANEVLALSALMPKLRKFSMIGHSLGGLYNRYCLGLLYARGFFQYIEPMNFVTLATPHLGIRRPRRGSFNFLWNALTPKVLSRTGQQLNLIDVPTDLTVALSRPADIYSGKSVYPAWTDAQGDLLVSTRTVDESTKSDEQFSQVSFEMMHCAIQDGKLQIWEDDMSTPGSTDQRKIEVDLKQAHVEVEIPDEQSVRRGSLKDSISHVLSFGRASNSSRGSSSNDRTSTRHYDVQVAAPEQEVVLRLSGSDWRWLVALSNVCLGLDCRTKRSDGEPAEVKASSHPPLLSCMTRGQFMQALQMFKVRTLYANIFFDMQVPYSCAAIRAFNPYRVQEDRLVTSPLYRHITLSTAHNAKIIRTTTSEKLKKMTLDYSLSTNKSSTSPTSPTVIANDAKAEQPRASIGAQGKSTSAPQSLASPSGRTIWPFTREHRRHTVDDVPSPPSSPTSKGSESARPEPFVEGDVVLDQLGYAFTSDPEQDALRSMLLSIQSVGWRRIDTIFGSVLAHEKIIAKRANPNKPLDSGLDVVHHAIDTFVL